jgi:hypothetical protein
LTSAAPVAWKSVALPVEHGGWGFMAEPALLGMAIAPSAAGVCLGLATLAAFLARHPLKLLLLDRRRGARAPRTALAARFALVYAASALLLVGLALVLGDARLIAPLLAAAPLGAIALAADAAGQSRDAAAEAAGAAALGGAATAIALAGGTLPGIAWAAWALVASRAIVSILYVRARLRLDRGVAAGPRRVLVAHAAALALALGLARAGAGPWLGAIAFLALLARAAWGLSSRRRRMRPQAIGYQELGYGLLTLALLAVGYRVGP